MKKFTFLWAFFLLLGSICTVSAEDYISLTFTRDGQNVTIAAADQDGTAISGVAGTYTGTHSLGVVTVAPTDKILRPDGAEANFGNGKTTTMTFAITGLPSDYEFNKAGLHILALNSSGGVQTHNNRWCNVDIKTGYSSDGLTRFAYLEDLSITTPTKNQMRETDVVNKASTSATGTLYIQLEISRGASNPQSNGGCFFGLQEIRLIAPASIDEAKEARDAHQNLPGYPKATYYDALNSAISTYETTASEENLTALQTAYTTYLETTDVILPEAGKTYAFISGRNDTNDAYAMYSDGADLRWSNKALDQNKFYWTLEADGDGFKIKNGDGRYIGGTPGSGDLDSSDKFFMETSNASAANTTFEHATFGTLLINIAGNQSAHPRNHDAGTANKDSYIISYHNEADKNASTWKVLPISGYELYNVVVTGLSEEMLYEGGASLKETTQKAYNGGFFVKSEDNFVDGDFEAIALEGFVGTVAVTDKTITVSYSVDGATFSTLLRGHIDNDAKPVLDKRGVGYPMTTSEAYTTFAGVVAEAEAAIAAYQENETAFEGTEIETLMAAIDTYKETTEGLQMPVPGKAYTITSLQNGTTDYHFYMDADGLNLSSTAKTTNDAIFICTVVGDEFVFVNAATGNYLVHMSDNNGYNSNSGHTSTYHEGACTFRLYSGNTLSTSNEKAFGSISIVGNTTGTGTGKSFAPFTINPNGGMNKYSSTEGATPTLELSSNWSTVQKLEEVTDYTYNKAELKASGDKAYSTLYLPYATTIPGDVQAYRAATLANNTLTMAEVTGTIPAETGVVLVGDAATHTFAPALEAGEEVTSLLTGIVNAGEAISNPDSKVICALNGANTIGFYKFTGTVRPGKAYLLADATMQAKGFTMNFGGETTGIEGIVTENTDKVVYDLSGRRIQNPTKGLYIIGGKKVYIK